MPVPQAQIHGPTDNTQALSVMVQALNGMGQAMKDYAVLSEQINQFDTQTQGKLFEEMLKSDKYKGDMSALATEHPALAEGYLNKLTRGDSKRAKEMFEHIKSAPRTPEEQGNLARRLFEFREAEAKQDAQDKVKKDESTAVLFKPAAVPKEAAPAQVAPAAAPAVAAPTQQPPIRLNPSALTGAAGVNPLAPKPPLPGTVMNVPWGKQASGNLEDQAKKITDDALRLRQIQPGGAADAFYFETLKDLKAKAMVAQPATEITSFTEALKAATAPTEKPPAAKPTEKKSDASGGFRQFLISEGKNVSPSEVPTDEAPDSKIVKDNQPSYQRYLASKRKLGEAAPATGVQQTAEGGAQKPVESLKNVPKAVADEAKAGITNLLNDTPSTPKQKAAAYYVVNKELKGRAKEIADATAAAMGDPEYINRLRENFQRDINTPVEKMDRQQIARLGKEGLNMEIGKMNLARLAEEMQVDQVQLRKDLAQLGLEKAGIDLKIVKENLKIQQEKYMQLLSGAGREIPEYVMKVFEAGAKKEAEIRKIIEGDGKDPNAVADRMNKALTDPKNVYYEALKEAKRMQAPVMSAINMKLTPYEIKRAAGLFGLFTETGTAEAFNSQSMMAKPTTPSDVTNMVNKYVPAVK